MYVYKSLLSLSHTTAANLASESGVQAGWGVKDMDDGSLTVAWRQPKGYTGPTPNLPHKIKQAHTNRQAKFVLGRWGFT